MVEVEGVSPVEAYELQQSGVALVDVRTVVEFDAGHPTGAYNVPWRVMVGDDLVPNEDFLAVMKRHFKLDQKIVLTCLSGRRSKAAAELMLSEGFQWVKNQRTGWGGSKDEFGAIKEPGWERCGLPTDILCEPGKDYATLSKG